MLGDRALRYTTAPCQFDDGDLVSADDSLEYGPARGVSERAHDGIYVRGFNHGDTLAHANQLVNPNLFLFVATIDELSGTNGFTGAIALLNRGAD